MLTLVLLQSWKEDVPSLRILMMNGATDNFVLHDHHDDLLFKMFSFPIFFQVHFTGIMHDLLSSLSSHFSCFLVALPSKGKENASTYQISNVRGRNSKLKWNTYHLQVAKSIHKKSELLYQTIPQFLVNKTHAKPVFHVYFEWGEGWPIYGISGGTGVSA